MENKSEYQVEITPEAERYYLDLMYILYESHSETNADKKSVEILKKALSLANKPNRGRIEDNLSYLNKHHRGVFAWLLGVSKCLAKRGAKGAFDHPNH